MSGLTYSKLESVNPDDYTEEKCWAGIEHLAELLNNPGALQYELRKDPKFGPQFNADNLELMHLLIDNFDFGVVPKDESVVDRMADLLLKLHRTQLEHAVHCIGIGSTFMQCLPINQILTSIEDDADMTKGMTPEQVEAYKVGKAKAEAGGRSMSACKMDPRIAAIISAGVKAAGGQGEFANLQMEIAAGIPEDFKENPSLHLTAQLTGALSRAIVERASSSEFNHMTTRTLIEQATALKQAVSMSMVSVFDCSPEQVLDGLQRSTKRSIMNALAEQKEPEVEAKPSEAKAASTMFAGNSTVN